MANRYYFCYSVKLKDFLKSQGLEYILKGLHHRTHRPFFMFERCDKLDVALTQWSERRKVVE